MGGQGETMPSYFSNFPFKFLPYRIISLNGTYTYQFLMEGLPISCRYWLACLVFSILEKKSAVGH